MSCQLRQLSLLALISLPLVLQAQWLQMRGPGLARVRAITVTSPDSESTRVYVALSGKGILYSDDFCASWNSADSGLPDRYITSFLVVGEYMFAGGDFGGLYRSSDHGRTWVDVKHDINISAVSELVLDDAYILAGGWRGGLYRSSDLGEHWEHADAGLSDSGMFALARLAVSSGDSSHQLVVSLHTGSLFRSTDHGDSWVPMSRPPTYEPVLCLETVPLPSGGTMMLAGTGGGVYLSTDGGDSWRISRGGINDLIISCFLAAPSSTMPGTTCLYLGTSYGVRKSTDMGETWEVAFDGLRGSNIIHLARATSPSGEPVLFAGGWGDGLFVSSDDGGKWKAINKGFAPVVNTLTALRVTDKGPIIYAGTGSGVSVANSVASSWSPMDKGIEELDVRALATVPGPYEPRMDTIFAGTCQGVFCTTDGGSQWTPMTGVSSDRKVNALACYTSPGLIAGFGMIGGTDHGTILSSDGGSSWEDRSNGLRDSIVYSVAAVPALESSYPPAFLAGTASGVSRSSDGGSTWWKVTSGLPDDTAFALFFSPNYDGWGTPGTLVGTGKGVFLSTNAGQSWISANIGIPGSPIYSLIVVPTGNVAPPPFLFAGTDGGVFYSGNSGASWKLFAAGLPDVRITSLAVIGDILFAGADDGWVWGQGISRIIASNDAHDYLVPTTLELFQNYPNPFNPSTTIRYSLPARSHVTLSVFNILGQRVAVLEEGDRDAGVHVVAFSGGGFASGVYVYRIVAGTYAATKRLLLLR